MAAMLLIGPGDTLAAGVAKINGVKDLQGKVLNAQGPVVIDVYTDWCGPCKQISPIIAELAGKYGSVTFYRIDGDANRVAVEALHVSGYPTVLFYSDGAEVDRLVGQVTWDDAKTVLEAKVRSLLGQ
jgi:thioredoxin 1